MKLTVVIAKAHEAQLQDSDIRREVASVQEAVNAAGLSLPNDAIALVPVRGLYHHVNRTMTTALLFVNCTSKSFNALRGEVTLSVRGRQAQVAKTTFDFDPDFLGEVAPSAALLVHFNIPVKGLAADETFEAPAFEARFDNVKARFCD